MMELKLSKYNLFMEENDQMLIVYNLLTGALIEISDNQTRETIDQFRNNISNDRVNIQYDLIENLMKCGILIPNKLNELEIIKRRYYSNKYANNRLSLTIIPTFDCNFECTYCYQKRKTEYMENNVIDAIKTFFTNNVKKYNNIHIKWYGGEPLLAYESIENLMQHISTLIQQNKDTKLSSGMVTNGLLLTKTIGDKLKKLGINRIQITFDGWENDHNKRRIYKNGNSYKTILQNIQDNFESFTFEIRINIDKENYKNIDKLLNDFKNCGFSNKKNFIVYLGHIKNYSNDFNKSYIDNLFSNNEFKEKLLDFDQKCITYGFPLLLVNKPKFSNCIADNANGFVINPDGNIFKCWLEIQNESCCIGNILNGRFIENLEKFYSYLSYDPFEDPKCKKCKLLPLCLGGCYYEAITQNEICLDMNYIKNKIKISRTILK